jgi:hypothetical protein
MIYISKMVPMAEGNRFYAFGRVFQVKSLVDKKLQFWDLIIFMEEKMIYIFR